MKQRAVCGQLDELRLTPINKQDFALSIAAPALRPFLWMALLGAAAGVCFILCSYLGDHYLILSKNVWFIGLCGISASAGIGFWHAQGRMSRLVFAAVLVASLRARLKISISLYALVRADYVVPFAMK
ncbi:MAG: hypothetical protein NTX50_23815 [Candidatus Sumerlaeota bacterium]|nr:hypothetical protein [Candidatus Sumerlaeota bacterium]